MEGRRANDLQGINAIRHTVHMTIGYSSQRAIDPLRDGPDNIERAVRREGSITLAEVDPIHKFIESLIDYALPKCSCLPQSYHALDDGSQMSRSVYMLFSDCFPRVQFLCFISGYDASPNHEIRMKYDSYFVEHSMNRT